MSPIDNQTLPLTTVYRLFQDGNVSMGVINDTTLEEVSGVPGYTKLNIKRVNGRVENDPKTGSPILKFTEITM